MKRRESGKKMKRERVVNTVRLAAYVIHVFFRKRGGESKRKGRGGGKRRKDAQLRPC